MNDITQLSTLYSNAIARAEKAENENRHLQSLNLGAHDVFARLWAIFGTPTYEELGGKSIYDLIQDAVDRAEKAEEALRKSEWQTIDTAPMDKTSIIIAVPTEKHDDFIVGEAYFDPGMSSDDGDWWWAGTSYGDYHGGPISDINYHGPTHWMPLPPPPPVRETP